MSRSTHSTTSTSAGRQLLSLPNLLTIARILAIPAIAALVLTGGPPARWLAFFLFAAAAITDYLDGYIARKMALISPLGRMLDPIADKLLVAILLLVFAYDRSFDAWMLWMGILILMREIAVAGLREYLGPRKIIVHVSKTAKYKTTLQLIALAGVFLVPLIEGLFTGVQILMALATLLTLYTGCEYFARAWPHLKDDAKP